MNTLQSVVFGFIAGLTDIFPVSSQAHEALLLTFLGTGEQSAFMRLMIHLAIFAALYYVSSSYILKMLRQRRLAKIPKRRRKRPVDQQCLLDSRLIITAGVIIVLGYILYSKTSSLGGKLSWISALLLVNGAILFVPALLPTGNKDSRALTPLDGVFIGLGGVASIFPGLSAIGCMTSVASVCGSDRTYAFRIASILQMIVTGVRIIYDVLAIISSGFGIAGFGAFLSVLLAAAAAFLGTFLAIRWMGMIAKNIGFHIFSLYCIGLALLTFILYLSI